MSTEEKINRLDEMTAAARQGGGPASVEKQHGSGKLTARERLDSLFDKGSFIETDSFVETRSTDFGMDKKKFPGDGVVTGYGTVDGRAVYASAQDFTVIGGSLGEMHAAKICKVMDMAMKTGVPFISLNDSGGARIQEGIDALSGYGNIFYRNTLASGVIPQISVIMGPCAGGAVYSPAITDFTFMVSGTSFMCLTGPDVVKAVTGENVTAEQLGGAEVHNSKSGVAHFMYDRDEDCIISLKKLLSFLPDNNLSEPAHLDVTEEELNRICPELDTIVPDLANRPYDVRDVIRCVVDNNDFMEIQEHFARNIVIGLCRINGRTAGIIANQPNVMAGALDYNSSDKAARFIRFCDSFNIPLISFTDTSGFLPGTDQEYNGVIRHGAKLLYAFAEATVPKINIIMRKAYGGAYIAMNSRHLGADMVFAWPTAEIAVMGPEGAANIIFRKEIASSDDPVSERNKKIGEYRDKFSNPYVAAARGYVDDVIIPSSTRLRIASALEMLSGKREKRPARKHGNIPL
ncbi:MAG: carboxyl transferase domain-containing protein [Eubacteriales bacterium]|nr:carboxyl transferase domain-containing protein [Eubacteriales bacterium]